MKHGQMKEVTRETRRRNVILALVHVGLAIAILAAFVYVQSHK
jgi:hypothetical protein